MKIIFTDDAEAALDRIYYFVLRYDKRLATRTIAKIKDKIEKLRLQPYMASVELSRDGDLRSLVVKPYYKVIYYVADETVTIIDIWDTRQDNEN